MRLIFVKAGALRVARANPAVKVGPLRVSVDMHQPRGPGLRHSSPAPMLCRRLLPMSERQRERLTAEKSLPPSLKRQALHALPLSRFM
jgi:hypothetical protein